MKLKLLLITAILFIAASGALPAHLKAASTSVTYTIPYTLYETPTYDGYNICFTCQGSPPGPNPVLAPNVAVTVSYGATVMDGSTNITNGGTVAPSDTLTFTFTPHVYSDISWVGTGYQMDSPYGDWSANAAPDPSTGTDITLKQYLYSCKPADQFMTFPATQSYSSYSDFVPLRVNPPTETLSGTNGLNCQAATTDANGNVTQVCTVSASSGTIAPAFNFAATNGRFYYRDNSGPGGECRGENSPFSNSSTSMTPPYDVPIPAASIPFSINVVAPNAAPNAPVITGPTTLTTGASGTYTFTASDSDGDTIRYGVDWDRNGTIDEWVPASGFVNSGTGQSTAHAWGAAGTYTFQALTQDSRGASSGWAAMTVTVFNPTPPTALLTANPTSVVSGNSSTLQWSSSNATSCTSPNFSTGNATSGTVSTGALSANQTYTVTCTGTGGSASDSATVTVTPPPNPDLTAGGVTPASAVDGIAVNLTATVQNIGNATSGSFPTRFQIDDSGQTTNIANPVSSYITLAAGASSAVSASYTFTAVGTYSVRACANQNAAGANIVSESNYANNCGAWTTVTVSPAGADLTAGSVTPTTATAGTSVNLVATASNIGDTTSGSFPTRFQIDDSGQTTNIANPVSAYTTLNAGASGPVIAAYTFTAAGTYSVRACANQNSAGVNIVTETNYANNCGAWTTITVSPAGADLTAGAVTPTTATAGTAMNFAATATNIGDTTSGSFPVLFQVQDSVGNNVSLIDSSYLAGLAAGASAQATIPYTFSSAGTYQVRACANENTSFTAIVTETNYANNCGPWTAVTVPVPPPTGALSCTVNNTNPTPGTTVIYTVTPSNGATGPYTWNDTQNGSYGTGATASRLITSSSGNYVMYVSGQNVITQPVSCPVATAGCGTPSGTVTANPTRVRANDTSNPITITWSASGVSSSCTLSGPGVNQTVVANSCNVGTQTATVPSISTQSIYTLTCGGTQVARTVVNVVPTFGEF